MLNVNHSRGYYPLNIEKCEEKYNAKYIGDFQTKRPNGSWNDKPCAIFYVENPDISKGHSNYFGLFLDMVSSDSASIMITNGLSAIEEPFNAIQADNGEYIISSYTHDYRVSTDDSVFIDGGRDYIRYPLEKMPVKLIINKDKFELFTNK